MPIRKVKYVHSRLSNRLERLYLTHGGIYTVERAIERYGEDVYYLKEIPGKPFRQILFEAFEKETE